MRFLPWLRGKFKRIKALLKKCSLEFDGIRCNALNVMALKMAGLPENGRKNLRKNWHKDLRKKCG